VVANGTNFIASERTTRLADRDWKLTSAQATELGNRLYRLTLAAAHALKVVEARLAVSELACDEAGKELFIVDLETAVTIAEIAYKDRSGLGVVAGATGLLGVADHLKEQLEERQPPLTACVGQIVETLLRSSGKLTAVGREIAQRLAKAPGQIFNRNAVLLARVGWSRVGVWPCISRRLVDDVPAADEQHECHQASM
jgi:hypothetical protein